MDLTELLKNLNIDLSTSEGQKQFQVILESQSSDSGEGEAEERAKPAPAAPVNAEVRDQPKVTGERVPHWKVRGFRAIQASGGMLSTNSAKREMFSERAAEVGRQYIAMSDAQREEEQRESERIVAAALSEKRIDVAGEQRILNLINDPYEQKHLSDQRAAGHSGLSGPAGELLIPKPMMTTLHTTVEEYGLAQRLGENVVMTGPGNSLRLDSISTAPTATWVGEDELFSVSNMRLDENVLSVYKIGVVSSITQELEDEDAIISMVPSWLRKVGESIALKIDQSYFLGDGSSTYGLMTGIANKAGAQVYTAGAGDLAPADLVEADFRAVKRLLTTARRRGAQWVLPRIVWDYIEEFESTQGSRIVQELLTSDSRQRFLSFPINLSEAMDNTDGDVASRIFGTLADYRRTYYGIKRGITVDTSREGVISNAAGVVQQNAFQQESILIKISMRVGHQVPVDVQDSVAVLKAPAV